MAIHRMDVTNTTVVADTDIPPNVTFKAHPEAIDFGKQMEDFGKQMEDQPCLNYAIKILYQDNKFVSPYGLGWHRYIKAARDRHEQNLDLCRQSNNTICFRTLRYIVKGEQLLVWYDTPLALELNIPIITIQHIKDAGYYICLHCNFESEFPNPLKSHMMYHCQKQDPVEREVYRTHYPVDDMSPSSTQHGPYESLAPKQHHNTLIYNNQAFYSSHVNMYSDLVPVPNESENCYIDPICSPRCNDKYSLYKLGHPNRERDDERLHGLSYHSERTINEPLLQTKNLSTSKSSAKEIKNILTSDRRQLQCNNNKDGPIDFIHKSFIALSSRKGHLCLYCGKFYSRKYGLKIHLRTHTGYKPLKCRICSRPFGDPSNLNKHVRLHAEGDTPYKCDICGKILVRRRDLARHRKSRHPETLRNNSAGSV